jgi:parallel beta-helix repeat protein
MIGRDALAIVGMTLLVLSSSFVFPVHGATEREPVAFDDTVSLGMTAAVAHQADAAHLTVPKLQVYYSGYRYVVGFYGVESYVAEQQRTGHDRQFGQPMAVFITDFAETNVSVTQTGALRTDGEQLSFVPAEETYVVIGSDANTSMGPTAVPFSEKQAATAFADSYGGQVVPWRDLLDSIETDGRVTQERFDRRVSTRSQWADQMRAETDSLRSRPVSIVVGDDEPTVAAAVAAAPPNTTVRLPPGSYHVGNLTVEKPITIEGSGVATTIRGDGNGSVIRVNATRVGITDLHLDGVGSVGTKPEAESIAEAGWSERIELAYGRGDAALKLDGADGSLVENVRIDTPASGIISRNATGAVVRNVTLRGAPSPDEGFMGVVAMYGPLVIENSRFDGGRDAIYTHRADGTVIRDNRMADARFGVHLMYTSNTLVRNNTIRNESAAIIIMTRPTGNLVVDNHVSESAFGISSSGSLSYYAENVVVGNKYGIDVSGTRSLYTHNTVTGNTYGLRGSTLLPTNVVTGNDVVANRHPVSSELGPLRVWTAGGRGNYWGPMPAQDETGDGFYDRSFRPTGPVDSRLHDTVGARTLARSPAVSITRTVQESVPGLRATGVVDTAPRVAPARPDRLAAVRDNRTSDARPGA